MNSPQLVRGCLLRATLFLIAFCFFAPCHTWAQTQGPQPASCADWTAVQSWSGTITVSGSGQSTDQNGNVATLSESATINFTSTGAALYCGLPSITLYSWVASGPQVSYSVTIQDTLSQPSVDSNGNPCTATGNWAATNTNSVSGNTILQLDYSNPTAPVYHIYFGQDVAGVTLTGSGCGSSETTTESTVWGPASNAALISFPLPSTISTLSGSSTFQAPDAFYPAAQSNWTVAWNMIPTAQYDVILSTTPDYSTWTPAGGLNETALGNGLIIVAQIINKTTGQPAQGVEPDGWLFLLKDFSQEPGVSLNWPPQNQLITPTPLDLDFKDPTNVLTNPNISVSQDGSTAQIPLDSSNQNNLWSVLVILDSHDWGAWATLNVSATVAGQTINGHFAGDSTTDILLPERQIGSHIADIWKTQNNIPLSTPDSDDSEPDPAGYPGCIGDGLTLYEEYRGFMENGTHIQGNPNGKDFFIENLIGGDALRGIGLFTQLTGLTVHSKMQANETKIDQPNGAFGSILINFNYAQGAHVTNQHGVILASQLNYPGTNYPGQQKNMDGGLTIPIVGGVHNKPRNVYGIAMQYRNRPGSLNPSNTHLGVITPTSAVQQYDYGIVHELLHSVGVDHHGDGDVGFQLFSFLSPDNPLNTTGQPMFQLNGQTVQLLPEEGGPNAVTVFWQQVQAQVDQCNAITSSSSQYPASVVAQCLAQMQMSDAQFSPRLYVGSPQGQHSGNDQCVMRYFFAQAYPDAALSNAYYLVPSGTEPLGSMICNSAEGTGVNDPDRLPQPRYFNAQPGRGGCQFWICVSDNPNYPLVPN